MCLSNLSGCELVTLASILAIELSQNLSTNDLNILSAFFSSLGDNFATIASTRLD